MQDAPVIVADEPTANLDPSSRTTVLEVLDDAAGDRTLLTVLHDMELAVTHYDRIVGVVDGSIRFDRPSERVTVAELRETFEGVDTGLPAARSPPQTPSLGQTAAEKHAADQWHATSRSRE